MYLKLKEKRYELENVFQHTWSFFAAHFFSFSYPQKMARFKLLHSFPKDFTWENFFWLFLKCFKLFLSLRKTRIFIIFFCFNKQFLLFTSKLEDKNSLKWVDSAYFVSHRWHTAPYKPSTCFHYFSINIKWVSGKRKEAMSTAEAHFCVAN